jgi:hypothetical protein
MPVGLRERGGLARLGEQAFSLGDSIREVRGLEAPVFAELTLLSMNGQAPRRPGRTVSGSLPPGGCSDVGDRPA